MGWTQPIQGSVDRDFPGFDHWIYGVVPGIGYTTKATSRGFDAGLYDPYLRGHYTPIRASAVASTEEAVDLRMFHPVRTGREILLSRISRGDPDESGRPTFMNHTVVVGTDPLRSGRLTLEAIFRAITEFDTHTADLPREIDLLGVPMQPQEEAPPRFGDGIHKHLTFPALEALGTRIMTDPTSRTLLLCRNTTPEVRNTTLTLLYELLSWGCGLPLVTAISEAPRSSALNFFNLVISPRGVRADSSWAILESALAEPALPRVLDRDDVYEALSSAIRQSDGVARAR